MSNPPAGWYPNPDLGNASSHRFWDGSHWTEHVHLIPARRRWKRVVLWMAIAIVASPVVLFVAFMVIGIGVAAVTGDNCAFDPPPGDVSTMTLVNDTRGPVEFVECDNATCSAYNHVDGGGTVAAGQETDWNHENCGREPVGIVDGSGALLGCIILPVDDLPKVTTWRVSHRAPCSGPIG
ncbi:hypothetical protein Back2_14570 [Nocardioides baekrokdamisoli]|uniref:DUF2510 domain-containing protein n=1 Tax=Nocardioides baekrokdamisoli TaxID=1804624 RepID=A0A3G9IDX5_9ACTN|nr:DUF2510 domain-containing protein [Nocardioides baekrokdamisoli]BBH17170.1 hypothetical protein Back2_14570 [Nocardioides baekrokdamisoli]